MGVEGGGLEIGIGQVDEGMEVAVQGMGKGAQGGGFAGADIAGDEGGQPFLEGKSQPTLNFLVAAGRKEVLGGDGATERGLFETIIIIEAGHGHPPEGAVGQVGRGWARAIEQSECHPVGPG